MEWIISQNPIDYPDAVTEMERRVDAIRVGTADEAVWLLEHPPVFTAGTSAKAEDMLSPRFPVYQTGRGGQYTYHGPGQRVAYVMLDLKKRQPEPDIKKYVWQLEEWIIRTLEDVGIKGERREGRVGIWVAHDRTESKIAAIGVRVRHWVTYHGISININPNLAHFSNIVPCGIREYGVTSLHQLGIEITQDAFDTHLQSRFQSIF